MKIIFSILMPFLILQACAVTPQRNVSSSSQAILEYQQKALLIEVHPEIFADNANKSKLREMLNKIRSIKNKLIDTAGNAIEHGTVGILAEAFAGIGVSKLVEFAVHEKNIGVFCAPGVSARTDVGVGVDLSVGKTLSCKSNDHYSGGFLGAFGGVSAEALGLPLAAGASYNIGINYPKFSSGLNYAIQTKKLSAAGLAFLYGIAYQVTAKHNGSSDRVSRQLSELIARLVRSKKSLSSELLAYLNTQELGDFLHNNKFYQLLTLTEILRTSLTGCDSVGGALGLSLSISPANVGVKYSDFKLLTEFDLEEMKDLNIISADIFENPYEYSISQIRKATSLATKLISIPFQLQGNKCSVFQVFKVQN